jgi:hypothetical protein
LSCCRVVKLRSSPRLHRSILFLSGRRHLLGRSHVLGALLGKLAGVRGAVAEPFAVEVEDVGGDDERDGGGGEDEAGDRELPLGAGLDLGVEGGGVERGDAGQEVAAEAVAAGGRGGVFAVGGDLRWVLVIEAWLGGGGGAGLTM